MARDPAARRRQPKRPLDLNPERAKRVGRPPYAIVDIGSNSVRLVVYDQLGRAPIPRFNEKSLCRLGEKLAETGAIQPDNFRRTIEATRRFRAIAEAMGVTRIAATGTEAIRRATNGPQLAAAIREESGLDVRILSGAEEARYGALGVISGFFRPIGAVGDMGGGSLEVSEALDDLVGDRWVSLPLGALPVETLLTEGLPSAKRAIDAMLRENLPPALGHRAFYPVGGGWRALAKAHMTAVGWPVKVVHGYTLETGVARDFAKTLSRLTPARLAEVPGVPERRARTLAGAALLLDRVLKRLAPERVVFSALGLREGLLFSELSEAERYLDPLVEAAQLIGLPAARSSDFAPELVAWTDGLFPGETAPEKRLRVAACALSDIAWRDPPDFRAEECFRRLLQFTFIGVDHAERVFIAAAIHTRYGGKPDDAWIQPAAALLSASTRARALILGRALRLAYRFSGGARSVLATARLAIEPDCVKLEVASLARAPDSEVVNERLALLAAAIGVRRGEIVVTDAK
jgi:exopolyphosphatase / guanosine-5'-triphosphate,3'-diphosphate pyrophosphatase